MERRSETPANLRKQPFEDAFGIEGKEPIVEKVLVFGFSRLVFGDLFLDLRCVEQLLLLEGSEQALERFGFHRHAEADRGGLSQRL